MPRPRELEPGFSSHRFSVPFMLNCEYFAFSRAQVSSTYSKSARYWHFLPSTSRKASPLSPLPTLAGWTCSQGNSSCLFSSRGLGSSARRSSLSSASASQGKSSSSSSSSLDSSSMGSQSLSWAGALSMRGPWQRCWYFWWILRYQGVCLRASRVSWGVRAAFSMRRHSLSLTRFSRSGSSMYWSTSMRRFSLTWRATKRRSSWGHSRLSRYFLRMASARLTRKSSLNSCSSLRSVRL
mmetsp:Transcript_3502/g.5972  ORF Transcript_3502/g.5972 Transcript_3502/m.5972 type:complete len:238 (-) Transcript_3502:1824-2537(-)